MGGRWKTDAQARRGRRRFWGNEPTLHKRNTARASYFASVSRSTSTAMRWASLAAGIPQYMATRRRMSWICSAEQPLVSAPLTWTRSSLVRPAPAIIATMARDRHQRQRRPAPHVAVGVSVDDVLQRLAERAERLHALVDGLVAEHLSAKLQALFVEVARIHALLSGMSFLGEGLSSRITAA